MAIITTISEMLNAANKIEEAAERFSATANQVFAAATELADSWEGDSQVAFVNEQQRANEWYNNMVTIVKSYAEHLRDAAKKYEEADTEAANAVKAH